VRISIPFPSGDNRARLESQGRQDYLRWLLLPLFVPFRDPLSGASDPGKRPLYLSRKLSLNFGLHEGHFSKGGVDGRRLRCARFRKPPHNLLSADRESFHASYEAHRAIRRLVIL